MIRVLLVDDHTAFRESLAIVLERHPGFDFICEAGNLAEARQWFGAINLALVGLPLPDDPDFRTFRECKLVNHSVALLGISSDQSTQSHAFAIEAGAAIVLPRSMPLDNLIEAMTRSCNGDPMLSPDETIRFLRSASAFRETENHKQKLLASLTHREHEVLRTLTAGLNDREIAERLNISVETVRTHFVNIMEKLNVHTRIHALVFAIDAGIRDDRSTSAPNQTSR